MLEAWAFWIIVSLPSYDGEIKIRFQTTTQESCMKLYKVARKEVPVGFTGTVGTCEKAVSQ